MSLWVAFTLAAAAMQTLRFVLQKQLKGAGLSTGGATFARFLFAAPIATVAALAALSQAGWALPPLHWSFAGFILMGALGQIIATFLTVALFSLRNFAVGIAFTKTETVQVAAFSALMLAESVSLRGWIAICIGLAGVLTLSRAPEKGARRFGRAAVYGLLAGGLFGLSAIGYRGATLALEPLPFLTRAVVALAAATLSQIVMMGLWLLWREPGEVARVARGWRRTLPVGITGVLGSMGWFAAFALQNAAYVRALGQVEIVFTMLASAFFFREKLHLREGVGIALVILSVILLVLGTA
jgi:drug/metabolite transporter (DMT)-like permease